MIKVLQCTVVWCGAVLCRCLVCYSVGMWRVAVLSSVGVGVTVLVCGVLV